jgi:hypothetical protein
MNKKEPTRYSMSTGLPHDENNQEVKKYPMNNDNEGSAEQAFLNFIQKAKESKRKYNERLEKENKDSD